MVGTLEKLLLAGTISTLSLFGTGCMSMPNVEVRAPVKKSTYDIVNKAMDFYRQGEMERAEKYLSAHSQVNKHPAIKYLLSLTYGANGDLIFNFGKIRASGQLLEELIVEFENDSRVVEDIKQSLPAEFFQLDLYRKNKQRLKSFVNTFPKQAGMAYGAVCFTEGDYQDAKWAWNLAKGHYPKTRVEMFAERIRDCAHRAVTPEGSMTEYHQIMSIYHNLNPPQPVSNNLNMQFNLGKLQQEQD
jgi:hypothetical protein